jgi:hypothetical protein
MKRILILAAMVLLVLMSTNAFSQDEEVKDILEVGVFGGMGLPDSDFKSWNDSLGAKSKIAFGAEVGRYLSPSMVLGFNFTYNEYNLDSSPTDLAAEGLTHRLYSPSIYFKYQFIFEESNFIPYLRTFIGVDFPKLTTFVTNPQEGDRYRSVSYDPALSYGFGGGLFYYTHDFGGIYLEGSYHAAGSSDAEADYKQNTYTVGTDLKQIDLRFGIRILFTNDE